MKKIKDLLRCIMLLYKRMLFFIAKITTKTDEKAVFFESFQGRSFACSPKAMYLQMQQDDKYKDLKKSELPLGECLMDTLKRVIDYYEKEIKKSLLSGQNVIIAAHGNSLRSLIKYLENISDDDIMNVEIPTGKPYVYEMDDNLNIINKYYL